MLEGGATTATSHECKVHASVPPKDKELVLNVVESLENSASMPPPYPIGCSSDTRVQNTCLPLLVTS